MTDVGTAGRQSGSREKSPELGHQIGAWISELDRDTNVLRGNVSELRQKYVRLMALAEEIRDDMSRVCLEFSDFEDDLGQIFDAIQSMNLRTTRFQVGIARNVRLLERLDSQSG